MQITTQCRCGGIFHFPLSAAGTVVQCGACRTHFKVPPAPAHEPPQEEIVYAQLAQPDPQPRARVASPVRRPPMPPRESRGSSFLVGLCIGFGIIVVAAFMIYRAVMGVARQAQFALQQAAGWVNMVDGVRDLGNIDEIVAEYEAKGYTKETTQLSVVREPIDDKRLFVCQKLDLKADVANDVAILSQMATIDGTVNGNVDFIGQVLVVSPGAHIKGDVHCRFAQMLTVKGKVDGKVHGAYQLADIPNKPISSIADSVDTLMHAKETITDARHWPRTISSSRRAILKKEIEKLEPELRGLITKMLASNFMDRRKLLEQLSDKQPDANAQPLVGEILIHFLSDIHCDEQAHTALKVWGVPENGPLLAKMITKDLRSDADEYFPLLIEWKDVESTLSMINSEREQNVANQSFQAVIRWEVDHSRIARQCIADIGKQRRIGGDEMPFQRLAQLEMSNPDLKKEVVAALSTRLNGHRINEDVLKLLSKVATKDDAPVLVANLKRVYDKRLLQFFADLAAPATDEFIVKSALEGHDSNAKRLLPEIGTRCERYVWAALKNRSFIIRNHALDLLSEIGSKESVPYIQPLAADTMSKRQAESALQAIESRAK